MLEVLSLVMLSARRRNSNELGIERLLGKAFDGMQTNKA